MFGFWTVGSIKQALETEIVMDIFHFFLTFYREKKYINQENN